MHREIYLLSPVRVKDIHALPMITFSPTVDILDLSAYDLLLFTSKQAVKSIDMLNSQWKEIPCLSIGSATTKQIELLGGSVVYQAASFYGHILSTEVGRQFKEKNIVYLRPKEVSFDLKAFLASEGMNIDEKIIYETRCRHYTADQQPVKNAIIIFTSPSTIRCFLHNFYWDSSYTAVVIGDTTQKHLPSDFDDVVVSDSPSIEACISKAREILLSSNSK